MFRRDAGADSEARKPRRQRIVVERIEVPTGEDPPGMPRSFAIAAAVSGWSPVTMSTRIPGLVRERDRVRHARTRRVNDPDQQLERQLVEERLWVGDGGRVDIEVAGGDPQGPQAFPCELRMRWRSATRAASAMLTPVSAIRNVAHRAPARRARP